MPATGTDMTTPTNQNASGNSGGSTIKAATISERSQSAPAALHIEIDPIQRERSSGGHRKRLHVDSDDERGSGETTNTEKALGLVDKEKRAFRTEKHTGSHHSDGKRGETALSHGHTGNTMQVAALAQKHDRLQVQVESLQDSFTTRGVQMDHIADKVGSTERVEREVQALQKQYEECSRQDLTAVHASLHHLTECLGKVDQLQRTGNLTAHEVQSFRLEYKRQIDAILAKLDTLSSNSSQRAVLSLEAVTEADIHQLRDELAICKDELTEMEPRRAAVENEFFQRMERFSSQLDHVRLQMSKMEQDLLQENDVCRRSLQNLLSRQMTQFRQSQGAENKRLRDEMDELRSDMCEILKEMHLLKERTKYLGRETAGRRGVPNTSPLHPANVAIANRFNETINLRGSAATHSPSNLYSGGCSSYLCPRVPRQYDDHVQVHNHDELYCQHHHCPAGIPHGQPSAPIIASRAAAESPPPPRLTQKALLQATAPGRLANAGGDDHHDLPRFCPSPHYSSRSSSVSGRISVTRDENAQPDEHANGPELERRLLEQHRLFWISEGAGSVSQTSQEPRVSKFPDEEEE